MYVELKVVVMVEQKENEAELDASCRARDAVAKALNDNDVRRSMTELYGVSFEDIEVIDEQAKK